MNRSLSVLLSTVAFLIFMGVATASAAPLRVDPRGGTTGVGFVLGDPLGPRFKTWLNHTRALDAGFGLGDDVAFYADYTFHGWDIIPRPERGRFEGYLGFGPRYEARDHRRDTFGVRFPAGISYFVDGAPIELYFELVPVLRVAPNADGDLDAGLGLTYYFN